MYRFNEQINDWMILDSTWEHSEIITFNDEVLGLVNCRSKLFPAGQGIFAFLISFKYFNHWCPEILHFFICAIDNKSSQPCFKN